MTGRHPGAPRPPPRMSSEPRPCSLASRKGRKPEFNALPGGPYPRTEPRVKTKTGTPPRRMTDSEYVSEHDYGETQPVHYQLEASMLENTAPPPTTAPETFLPAAAHINIPCLAQPERNRTGNRAVRRRRTQTGFPQTLPSSTGHGRLCGPAIFSPACKPSAPRIGPSLLSRSSGLRTAGPTPRSCSSNSAYNETGSSFYSKPR